MVKQEALGGDTSACAASTSTKAEGSKSSLGSSETSTSNMISDGDRLRRNNVPNFQPFDTEEARARAAVEQWRTFTMLIEPQVSFRGKLRLQLLHIAAACIQTFFMT